MRVKQNGLYSPAGKGAVSHQPVASNSKLVPAFTGGAGRGLWHGRTWLFGILIAGGTCIGQAQPADVQLILQRLDRLEAQNQELMAEIRALREQLGAPNPVQNPEAKD